MTEGKTEDQAQDSTKSGTTSGTISSTLHTRRPGSTVRSVSHAAPVPSTADRRVTKIARRTVFHSSVATNARSRAGHIWLQPAWTDWMTISASGESSATTTTALKGPSSHGNRRRRWETRRRNAAGRAAPLTL